MTILEKYKFIVIIALLPLFCQGQNGSYYSDSIQAVNLYRKAINLFENELYAQSLDSFYASLNLRKQLFGSENSKLAGTFLGIGIVYGRMGQFDLALKNYKLAESNYLLAKTYPFRSIVSLYNNIGIVYRFKLDYEKALQYFEQALSVSVKNLNAAKNEIASINYNISEIYYLLNKYDKAIEIINSNLNNANPEDKILYYELLAFIYQLKGDIKKSRRFYENVIDLTININEKNHISVATAYLNYANFLISADQFEDAGKMLYKANQIIQSHKTVDGRILSDLYRTEGLLLNNKPVATQNLEIFRKQKSQNLLDAVSWFMKGLAPLNFNENNLNNNTLETEKIISLINCITLLKLIADNYYELSRLEQIPNNTLFSKSIEQAINYYQMVGTLIQKARVEISDDESKIQLTSLEYNTFYKIIQVSHEAYSASNDFKYLEMAFQNAERVKSSSIFDKISDQFALENSLIPDSLLYAEKKINNTITVFSEKLYEEENKPDPDSSLINEYNNEIFTAKRNRDELNRFLENEYKDYFDLKYSASMLSAKQIQQKLRKDQTLIEYVLNETDTVSELYTFIISPENIGFHRQKVDETFMRSISAFFHFMSNKEYLFTKNEDSKNFCVAANVLYSKLLLPFKMEIKNKNIVIVPDGKLSYVPFDALLENLPDTSKTVEFNRLNYAILSYCFNYSNSANLLFKQLTKDHKNKIRALAFAPVYKEGETIEIAQKKLSLLPLPGVEKEVKQISKIINIKIFKGEDATEKNFRNNVEKYDILHLSMHAFINDSLPAFSSFAFSKNISDDQLNDGILNTADIYNLKLNAKLTVLSACNTGTGKLRKGEGIMSLARGFLYAGCPAILMSLWEVEDESTTQIMTSFYKHLKKGKTKDESLRLAKLEYLDSVGSRRAHPHYWLGFVSFGDNSSFFISYDFYFFILLILALLGIGIDQAVRIKKARKKQAF